MAFFAFAKVGKGRLSRYVERFCNKKSFICSSLFRYYIKQIDSMLPCVCHRIKSHVSVFLKRGGNMQLQVFRYVFVLRKRENSSLRDSVTFPERKCQVTFPSFLSQQISAVVRFRHVQFCKRICSLLLHLPKHKREIAHWTPVNLNILGDQLQMQPQEVPHLTLRKMTNIRWYEESVYIHNVYGMISWRIKTLFCDLSWLGQNKTIVSFEPVRPS